MIDDKNLTHEIGASGFWETKPAHLEMAPDKVRIAWNLNAAGQIADVLITDNPDVWEERSDMFQQTGGACYTDWMTPAKKRVRPAGLTPDQVFDPAGVFGTMLSYGFADKGVMRQAIIGFAGIRGCSWARRFLFAIDGELNPKDLQPQAEQSAAA